MRKRIVRTKVAYGRSRMKGEEKKEKAIGINDGDSGSCQVRVYETFKCEKQIDLTDPMGWDALTFSSDDLDALKKIAGEDVGEVVEKSATNAKPLQKKLKPAFEDWSSLSKVQKELVCKFLPVKVETEILLTSGDFVEVYKSGSSNQFVKNPFSLGCGEVKIQKKALFENVDKSVVVEDNVRMRVVDDIKWVAGIQDENEREFWFEGEKLNGRFIFKKSGDVWSVFKSIDQIPKSESLRKKLNIEFTEEHKDLSVELIRKSEEKRIVIGIVLKTEVFDAQNEIYSDEVVEAAAHDFLANYNIGTTTGVDHSKFFSNKEIEVVESYIAPTDFVLNGREIKKGWWLAAFRINDDSIWQGIKKGDYTGFSVGGTARFVNE